MSLLFSLASHMLCSKGWADNSLEQIIPLFLFLKNKVWYATSTSWSWTCSEENERMFPTQVKQRVSDRIFVFPAATQQNHSKFEESLWQNWRSLPLIFVHFAQPAELAAMNWNYGPQDKTVQNYTSIETILTYHTSPSCAGGILTSPYAFVSLYRRLEIHNSGRHLFQSKLPNWATGILASRWGMIKTLLWPTRRTIPRPSLVTDTGHSKLCISISVHIYNVAVSFYTLLR